MLNVPPCQRSKLSSRFAHLGRCHPQMQLGHEASEPTFLSWLASQLFRIKSLIQHGLAVSARPAESLCEALELLLIAFSLPLIVACISSRTSCKGSEISCLICCCKRLQVCCGGHTCLLVMLCDCCCYCRGSRRSSTDSTSDVAYQRSATLSNGREREEESKQKCKQERKKETKLANKKGRMQARKGQ